MFRLSSVAGFARDHDMLALLLLIHDIAVADFANVVAGEGHGPGRDLSNRCAAIVSVLAETGGDDEGAQADERNQCDGHDRHEPDEVFDVFEQVVRRRELRAKLRNASWIPRIRRGNDDSGHRSL